MNRLLRAFLPALLMGGLIWACLAMPRSVEFLPSALTPPLPYGHELEGWYGQRTQESAAERQILAKDTEFHKGIFVKRRDDPDSPPNPYLDISLIFSGKDMNNSIHRPEGCLPAQGHLSLKSTRTTLRLADGQELTFSRLTSLTPDRENPRIFTQHIHYYVFVGHDTILASHVARMLRDICDRATSGRVQRWAYFQAGVQWGGNTGHSEAEAEAQLIEFIAQAFPQLINWEAVRKRSAAPARTDG